MPKFLDISGNRYGRLVAISPHGKRAMVARYGNVSATVEI